MQRKLILLVLLLLMISAGIAAAQSSTNFTMQRFVTMSGGLADSANFKVTSVIGQKATDVVDSSNYKVAGGFLHPLPKNSGTIWLPLIVK